MGIDTPEKMVFILKWPPDFIFFSSIGYILNVTREIANFFQGMFNYKNIRLYDKESSELLRHWDSTYRFIQRAR